MDCVICRVAPEGEYDLDMESTLHSVMTENQDDGTLILRAKQQMTKFNNAAGCLDYGSLVIADAIHTDTIHETHVR